MLSVFSNAMELCVQTFLWLRDFGGIASDMGRPSPSKNGMIELTSDALTLILQGSPVVSIMLHYCVRRFEAPEAFHAKKDISLDARRHNWEVVRHIAQEALGLEITQESIEKLVGSSDVGEALILIKKIYEELRLHRAKEREEKQLRKEQTYCIPGKAPVHEIKKILETKSAASQKKISITKRTLSPPKHPHAFR